MGSVLPLSPCSGAVCRRIRTRISCQSRYTERLLQRTLGCAFLSQCRMSTSSRLATVRCNPDGGIASSPAALYINLTTNKSNQCETSSNSYSSSVNKDSPVLDAASRDANATYIAQHPSPTKTATTTTSHHSSSTTSTSHNTQRSSVAAAGIRVPPTSPAAMAAAWIWRLVCDQYLPLMLLTALAAAALQPDWGLAASRTPLQMAVTFAIFVLQGVMLRKGEAEKALEAPASILWGLLSILVLTPLAAPLMGALPLHPPGLALGLLVFACMPTTLSSGVALTQVLGGNTALALLLTISSNLLAVFSVPLVLPWALKGSAAIGGFTISAAGGGSVVRLDPLPLLVQLVQCILVPTLVGAGLRGVFPGLRSWVDANRRTLSVISGALLSLVPWMQVSKALSAGLVLPPAALVSAVGCSLGLHAVYLGANTAAAQLLQLGGSDPHVSAPTRRALILVTSQKTLPVALTVLGRLGPLVGGEAAGAAALTAVFSHLAQTVADFGLVARWTEYIQRREAAEAEQQQQAGSGGGPQGGLMQPAAG